MCTICGCGEKEADHPVETAEQMARDESHHHDHQHNSGYECHQHNAQASSDRHNYGSGAAGLHVPGLSQQRIIQIQRDILSKNGQYAAANRARFTAAGVLALNLMSSPGSGKTTLLARAITDLCDHYAIAVIEGDQQTSNDAERIRATGVPAVQVNTGKGCHLDAHMIAHALDALPLVTGGLLFIENVGNLVCPAAFDLGEAQKVVVFSVTEGEDKPVKYPDMFAAADLMLINKADLIPHLDFDLEQTIEHAHRVNPCIEVLIVSARTGDGMPAFYSWIGKHAQPSYAAVETEG